MNRMQQHRTDLLALLFGLAFVIVGGSFVGYEVADSTADPAWIAAVTLVILGAVALGTTLLRRPAPAELPDEGD